MIMRRTNMSKIPAIPVSPIPRETIEHYMAQARRERAEAVAQLFGFGFTVVRETLSGRRKRWTACEGPAPHVDDLAAKAG
jgi:hypothetical protein